MERDKARVGVDVGGTNTVIGVFDSALELKGKSSFRTRVHSGPERTADPRDFWDELSARIIDLVRDAGFEGMAAAGLGIPGWVDPAAGIALSSSNLGWRNVQAAESMSRRLGVPVRIDNDVRLYTLGEAEAGAGAGCGNLLCLTVGTGLAAGLMLNGRLIRGSHLFAGEIGHDPVEGNEWECKCGKTGCLETVVSAGGIVRLAKEKARNSGALAFRSENAELTAAEVYRACLNGDPAALEAFRYVGTVLARKLMTLISLTDPEMVIVGGGVAEAGDYLLGPVREFVEAQYPVKERMPAIRQAVLGDEAGLQGAVRLAASSLRH